MARVKKQTKQMKQAEDLVQVDAYMIPAPMAEMYRVLREAVANDIQVALQEQYDEVKRICDNAEEGEAIVAYQAGEEMWRYYLSPTNISNAQKAREKDHLDKYLETLGAIPVENE